MYTDEEHRERRRIPQVLGNLLANAAKHSPESFPIRISAERDGDHVAVSVADEGAGIPPEDLARLFRKHVGDGANGRRRSGLGLVICEGLVEAHGGRIRADSGGRGRGARFTFTVPVADFEPGDAAAQGAPATSRVAPTPILVVDDDPQTLRHLRDTLADAGYAPIVTGVHTGLTKIIEAEKPRLVLLDLMLPGTDGIELMRTVPALAELPVIFISAYGRDETVARALDSGALDYIVKPFSPAELTARIRVALRRRDEPESFRLGDLAIDYGDRRTTLAGRHASLTSTEYEVLRLLSLRPGRLLTNAQLLDSVWGETGAEGTARLRTIIKKLRRKLGDDAGNPTWIFSERGVGYCLARPKEDWRLFVSLRFCLVGGAAPLSRHVHQEVDHLQNLRPFHIRRNFDAIGAVHDYRGHTGNAVHSRLRLRLLHAAVHAERVEDAQELPCVDSAHVPKELGEERGLA